MIYDLEYFIEKFSSIPDDRWIEGRYIDESGCCCALGHCGHRQGSQGGTIESFEIQEICPLIHRINDGYSAYRSLGSTPKERVVNYLKSLRK